jgi:hypothetical protein
MGNNPKSNGGYMPLPDIQFSNEVVRDQYFKNQAIAFIKANPGEFVKLALRRFVITYDRETIGVAWNEPALVASVGAHTLPYLKFLSSAYWWLLVVSATIGVCVSLGRRRMDVLNPLLVVASFFFIVPLLTVGQDRYHLPLDPFVAIFAAFAVHTVAARWLTKNKIASNLTGTSALSK